MTLEVRNDISVFKYKPSDFHYCVRDDENSSSTFDTILEKKWQKAEKEGILRYSLRISWKILDGNYKFLAQLNPDRVWNRRTPEYIVSMSQPFDAKCFNFNKLPQNEILFDIGNGDGNNILVFNISPIESGHYLLLVDRLQCLPQCITERSLRKAIDLLLLSSSRYARVIFNSLCAHASVNHLHWHLYYLPHTMLLECINVEHCIGPLFLLTDFPSRGFCLKATSCRDTNDLVQWTFIIAQYLQEHEIAHNVYITRAKSTLQHIEYDDIRIYIWARESYRGVKNTFLFMPAVCELFGHLSIRSEEAYQTVTEKEVSEILYNLTSSIFLIVKEELKKLIHKEINQRTNSNLHN